jgi:tripartite-type tricarboxylate transporter receptor subunit TctC
LLGGQVQVAFADMPPSIEHITAGRLRALAVTTGTGSPMLPNIPTLNEFLPGFEASAWIGIGAPRSSPAEIIDKLNTQINSGLADAGMVARLAVLGLTVLPGSPAEFSNLIADDTEKWAKVMRAARIKPDKGVSP